MSDMVMQRAEELRQSALAMVRAGEFEAALATYDEALALSADEELCELITINKADTLVALEQNGPEVQALPMILMRRRTPRHTFLASYTLLYKHRTSNETKRAMFYGHLAYDTAVDAGETFWQLAALNELGVVYEIDSQFEKAIEFFEKAIAIIDGVDNPLEHKLSYGLALENLGAAKLQLGKTTEGIADIEKSIDALLSPTAIAEAYIDLCFGYLELEDLDRALWFGEQGLEIATETRQVRNAHYLLGEVCYKRNDIEGAEHHFDELARFYPEFRNLKTLLYAIDLRSMINFKL
jgi:tetratricopeptide (TPR) repeat protein